MLSNFSVSLALIAGAASASYGQTTPYYHSYVQAPQQHSYHSSYSPRGYYNQEPESPKFSHPNPWGADDEAEVIEKEGWWSPYQEFRPPIVKYHAVNQEACYATCEDIFTDGNLSGYI